MPWRRRDTRTLGAAGAVAYVALWVWLLRGPGGISWHWFADGARWLDTFGTGLYAVHPEVQIGPLTLLLVRALVAVAGVHALGVAQAISVLALIPGTWGLRQLTGSRAAAAGWLMLVPAWIVLAVRWSHLDDVLALTALAVLVGVVARSRREPGVALGVWAGLLVVVAVGAKPWAVAGLPLLLALGAPERAAGRPAERPVERWRARWVAVIVALAGLALCWLPFLWSGTGALGALTPRVRVADTTALWWLELHEGGLVPTWVRPVQLLGALALALIVVLRKRWALALLAGVAWRLALDPQNIAYYAAAAILVALVADLAQSRFPRRTLVTALVFWQPFVPDYAHRLDGTTGLAHWWFSHPMVVAIAHGLWAAVMIIDALTAGQGWSPGERQPAYPAYEARTRPSPKSAPPTVSEG